MNYLQQKHGFTLIELLVVVLIIGILAAVALPQYQRAVEKARMTEAITAVESIARANDLYFLANGEYTRDINDLDIDFPGEDGEYCNGIPAKYNQNFLLAASNCSGDPYAKALIQRRPQARRYTLAIQFDGRRLCGIYADATEYQKKLCQAWANGQ